MFGKRFCVTIAVLTIFLTPPAFAGYPGKFGVGFGLAQRGGTFVDLVKENYRWSKYGGADLNNLDVDSQGWPIINCQYVYDGRPVAEWSSQIDDPDVYRVNMSGVWKCSFIGQATLGNVSGGTTSNKVYDAGSNTTTFNFTVPAPAAGHGLFIIGFNSTRRTPASPLGSGITDFKMLRPGYPHGTTQLWYSPVLAALASADFAAMRYMGFTASNGEGKTYPATTPWSSRKLPTDASQDAITLLGKWEGGCWEYVIDLANTTGIDPWINVPVSADADYVTQLATMFRDNLDPNLHVYVESSNEVWNAIFPQCFWNRAQAFALGINEHQNHARRTVELAQSFETVFGPNSVNNRVRVVLCTHAPNLKWWLETHMIPYINSHYPGHTAKDFLYAIARQTYFGGPLANGNGTGTVQQILDGCHSDITSQISQTTGDQAGRLQWIQKAAAWQLTGGCCSYEGGNDFGGGSTTNIANRIRAVRDPRMGDEVYYNFGDAFFAIGGNIACNLELASGYNRYGCWGLTDDIKYPDRNYQFQAGRQLLGNLTADFSPDGIVNFKDFAVLAGQWRAAGSTNLDGDGAVDYEDLLKLSLDWTLTGS